MALWVKCDVCGGDGEVEHNRFAVGSRALNPEPTICPMCYGVGGWNGEAIESDDSIEKAGA